MRITSKASGQTSRSSGVARCGGERAAPRATAAALAAVLLIVLAASSAGPAAGQATLRSAVVVLSEDPQLRAEFERALVAKATEHHYDAVTSYEIVPDVEDLSDKKLAKTLAEHGVQAVLMLRPAAVGPGSSLESVRDEVDPKLYDNMRAFAKDVSPSGADDLIAVVHLAIYTITDSTPELISGGAVWLDEEVDSREEALDRLEDLVIRNVDAVRPAIREHLGLPPLQ